MTTVSRNRSKSSPELLAIGRCQRILEGLSPDQAIRVAKWLLDGTLEARHLRGEQREPTPNKQEPFTFG